MVSPIVRTHQFAFVMLRNEASILALRTLPLLRRDGMHSVCYPILTPACRQAGSIKLRYSLDLTSPLERPGEA